jgi:hypothetical protein
LTFWRFYDIETGFDWGRVRVLDAADDSEIADLIVSLPLFPLSVGLRVNGFSRSPTRGDPDLQTLSQAIQPRRRPF